VGFGSRLLRLKEPGPILQIGGVKDAAAQDRIIEEIRRWPDKSRFDAVTVYVYGDPKDAADPSSALLNMIRDQKVELGK
jgi:hypothetical protein